jgi:hypothetical protein
MRILTILIATLLLAGPALAVTAKEKKATCEFGADDQKLDGAARKSFMAKCMANEGRSAKPATKPKPAAAPLANGLENRRFARPRKPCDWRHGAPRPSPV